MNRLLELLRARGHEPYGVEPIAHLEHALQCATLAEEAGGSDALITAALLHDIGHFLGDGASAAADQASDQHATWGANALEIVFGAAVAFPVRWHLDARRWMASDRAYDRLLSFESRRAVVRQGGIMTMAEREEFLARPYAAESVSLCRWDEAARTARRVTPSLEYFADVLERVSACGAPFRAVTLG